MYAIRAKTAFDGAQTLPGGALVVLDGERIVAVQSGADPAPDGCDVLDVPNGTVLPGLIDTHTHLCADGTDGALDRLGEPSDERVQDVISDSLRCHLAAGVTTVRDLGDRRFAVCDWRASSHAEARIRACSPPVRRSPASADTARTWAVRRSASLSCAMRCANASSVASTSSR